MPAWLKKVHPWAVGTPPQASPFHKPTHGRLKIVSGANTASTDIFTVRGQRVDPRKNISEYATIEFHPKSSIPYPNPVVRAVNMDIPGITTNLAGRVKTYKRHHDFKLHHFPSAMEPRLLTLNNFQRQAESKMFNLYKIVDESGTCVSASEHYSVPAILIPHINASVLSKCLGLMMIKRLNGRCISR